MKRLALAACVAFLACSESPTDVTVDVEPSFAAVQACQGQIIAGIANTWPWAHDGQMDFQPPKGAIALWIELFGPDVGISSVSELQDLFCGA